MLPDLETPSEFPANFYSNRQDLCVPDSIYFYEDCPDEQEEYYWDFEEGSPPETSEPSPQVFYAEIGMYDVSLSVSDSSIEYTMIRGNYITDTGAPSVTFDEIIPPLCNEDWDPYLLTGGLPEGGEYKGAYITEGKFFHPTEAGTGTYAIVYTYIDEWDCEGSDYQTIEVVDCVNTDDVYKGENGISISPNPNDGEFFITLSEMEAENIGVMVISELGIIVYMKENIKVNKEKKLKIVLEEDASGVYSVVLHSKKGMISKRVIVK
jgi:hypothetical protein